MKSKSTAARPKVAPPASCSALSKAKEARDEWNKNHADKRYDVAPCTCPEPSSFGHEPGCPRLAQLREQRESEGLELTAEVKPVLDAFRENLTAAIAVGEIGDTDVEYLVGLVHVSILAASKPNAQLSQPRS